MRAHGCGGASAFSILYFLAPVVLFVWKSFLQAGKNSFPQTPFLFARLPKRSPAACSVRSKSQQKSFLFLLEEKIRRAQKKSRENFFAGWRALASGGGEGRQNLQSGFSSKKVRISSKRYRQVNIIGWLFGEFARDKTFIFLIILLIFSYAKED